MQHIYTIGHSTRPIEEFVALLQGQHITQLVDVRTIPRSRYNPQYEQTALETSLPAAGIQYIYLKELGGLRPSIKNSQNTAWRNKSFRNYADYMQTEAFTEGLAALTELSQNQPTAIMCAEAVPWRCHRSLIADALVARKIVVTDIIAAGSVKRHTIPSFAVVKGTVVTYPGDEAAPDAHR